ncbi:hypothetical protein P3T22_005048 [Paraburkholderia sp. GAS348]
MRDTKRPLEVNSTSSPLSCDNSSRTSNASGASQPINEQREKVSGRIRQHQVAFGHSMAEVLVVL